MVVYKLSSQIRYALRSHAADLAEEEDRVLASLGSEQASSQEDQDQETVDQPRVDRDVPVKKGRGRPRKSVVDAPATPVTPVKQKEKEDDVQVVIETSVPVFTVEPPTVRRPDPTQSTPVRRTRTSLVPPPVASPAARTRSRKQTEELVALNDNGAEETQSAALTGNDDMIVVTPVKPRTIRKTRSSSKLAD